jgi:hypothetical protein
VRQKNKNVAIRVEIDGGFENRSRKVDQLALSLLFVFASFCVASSASARTVVVDCQTVRNISHSRVHFGMSVMGSRVSAAEKNYLHGQYHQLTHTCHTNPKARAHLRVSPQLSSLMDEYGFPAH